MAWDQDLTLKALCERLWDMARYAFMDLDKAANFSARNWAADPTGFQFPIDSRRLREATPTAISNVVRYERRGGERFSWPKGEPSGEVFYIGEDTPVPPMPRRKPPEEDDILYIGDDD